MKNWLSEQEKGISPKIILNGDFNFPLMGGWDEDKVTKLLEQCDKRTENGQNLSKDKIQARMLYDFGNENMMSQFITNPTRKENILDLLFCSDESLVGEQEMIENIIHSDHTFNFVDFNIKLNVENTSTSLNQYTTSINNYEIKEATELEWENYNKDLLSIEWEKLFNINTDVDTIGDVLIEEIEKNIS